MAAGLHSLAAAEAAKGTAATPRPTAAVCFKKSPRTTLAPPAVAAGAEEVGRGANMVKKALDAGMHSSKEAVTIER